MTGEHWRGATAAELDWSQPTPRSTRFEDTYFSAGQGIEESRHVFLAGNALPLRWRNRDHFTIVETGFGTGLNFLTTWDAWRRDPDRPQRLHMLSVEAFPMRRGDLQRALASVGGLSELSAELLQAYPPPVPGLHRLHFDAGRVCLDLLLEPLESALEVLTTQPGLAVDCWYLDGFAPARNPEMWTPELFQAMARLSRAECSVATFTAAGEVRRALADAGFTVTKAPGFARKREMLTGRLATPAPRPLPSTTPWHLPACDYPDAGSGQLCPRPRTPSRAVIVGAGLAGATVAKALARRGWAVSVYDQGAIAGAASGNAQGVLYTRLSHRRSELNSFSLHSFCHASRIYRALFSTGELVQGRDGELCGCLHLRDPLPASDPLFETVASLPGLVKYVDAVAARTISGLSFCRGGLYYPGSGWLSPPAVCRALLAHPGITVHSGTGALRLRRDGEHWALLDSGENTIDTAPVAVVACGADSGQVIDLDWLRLQSIRGQTSQLTSRGELQALRTVICDEGYLPPATGGEHCMGATFDIDDPDVELRPGDHASNLAQLQRALPGLTDLNGVDPGQLSGRVGFRCASPDYLPVAGAVPDPAAFAETYAGLRRNARQLIARPGPCRGGLYISTGHGSRGLTSTPLCAELLAAQITGEAWPLPAELARALSPARFLVRDLKRNLR